MRTDLFDPDDDITANFHGGNRESLAAKELSKKRAAKDRARIVRLAQIRGIEGITCDEAERLLDLSHQTCSARFSELKRDGILVPTRATRLTRNRSPARVMVLGRPTP